MKTWISGWEYLR